MTMAKIFNPPDFSLDYLEQQQRTPAFAPNHQLHYALLLSLALHVVVYFWLPYLKQTPLPKPVRFEVELSNLLAREPSPSASISAPAQPELVQEPLKPPVQKPIVKPTPVVKPKAVVPVLAIESTDASTEHTVPIVSPTASESAVTQADNAPQTSTASETSRASSETGNNSAKASESATLSEASQDEAWDGYGQQLYEMVGRNKYYPAIAIRKHWEGDVKILARFVAGNLVEIKLLKSSGREILDDEAISMLKKAISKIPVKGNLASKNFSVIVPVDFKLD
jgi:periplasmic protein TonB